MGDRQSILRAREVFITNQEQLVEELRGTDPGRRARCRWWPRGPLAGAPARRLGTTSSFPSVVRSAER